MKEPFNLVKKKIIVIPKIRGRKGSKDFSFILDTGASVSIISDTAASFLGYNLSTLPNETLTTIGGRTNAKSIKLPAIELCGKTIPDFEIKIMSMPLQVSLLADGLIGMDFLLNFNELRINFDENFIETY